MMAGIELCALFLSHNFLLLIYFHSRVVVLLLKIERRLERIIPQQLDGEDATLPHQTSLLLSLS